MADTTSNGIDVEMKDETATEAPIDSIQEAQQADPTDPNPPPQAQSAPAVTTAVSEHLSTIAPAVVAASPAATTSTARPSSMPPQPTARPDKAVAHGGPTRQYLNQNITPHLLEGMKYLAMHEPQKPLHWLGKFLSERSKEVED